jgi:hypothetical protein
MDGYVIVMIESRLYKAAESSYCFSRLVHFEVEIFTAIAETCPKLEEVELAGQKFSRSSLVA